MREQLIQYVNLLFAGNDDTDEIRQEILQNTLDRYDDLVSQGKSPEAAYRLAISGIGDISEILGGTVPKSTPQPYTPQQPDNPIDLTRIMRAVAIGLFIVSIIPLILLDMVGMDIIGLCMTLVIVAIATVILLLFKKPGEKQEKPRHEEDSPANALKDSIHKLIWAFGLTVYFILSFATGAWYITWLIFPIAAAVRGLVNACIDLKEAV